MAFIRKQGQGVMTNEPEYPVNNGMLGSANVSAKTQPTQAGQPGGWTNIQDYLGANAGDTTNINLAKQKSQENIQKGAEEVSKQAQGLTSLPTAQGYDPTKLNEALASDNYDVLSKGMSQEQAKGSMTALPTVNEELAGYAPIEQGVANVNPQDFQSSMEFIGSLAPQSPTYSAGQQAFDTMLLQGSPEFRTSFVPTMKEQYKTLYQEPLEAARTSRATARETAGKEIEKAGQDWRTGISGYLTGEEGKIQSSLDKQKSHYNKMKDTANINIEERINKYTQTTGERPPEEIVNSWRNDKTRAQNWLQTAQKPNKETAINEYIEIPGDTTRMQDLQALYNVLGITPEYTQPVSKTKYDYSLFM